ncbi:hypothetical protein SAMN02745179_00110 [Mycoplasmopsis agassizii]|nr:hypothetical protein SAMN02745179_00110 [Mycoplasmopsis agassizii]
MMKLSKTKIKNYVFKNKIALGTSALIVAFSAAAVGIYFAVQNNKPEQVSPPINKPIELLREEQIFSDFHSEDFYKYVKIKDGDFYLEDNIIASFIKDQISRMAISYGWFTYEYQIVSPKVINLKLTWSDEDNNKISRVYNFEVSKSK